MAKARRRVSKKNKTRVFDKYELYFKSVQAPDGDVIFFRKVYRELKKKDPKTLREDFCGTFAISCEWAKLNKNYRAVGVDLDPEPLHYGKNKYLTKLNAEQQKRVSVIERNVLDPNLPKADIAAALNFSYFIFRTRKTLKKYFENVRKSLPKDGIFIMDLFGGKLCADQNEEATKHRGYTYYWDQESFDPVTNRAQFYIHFKLKGQKKVEHVFSYDWRMWTIPELRDILEEAGFSKTHVYWEGTNSRGGGNGIFSRTEKGEACDSWIAYIVSET